MSFLRNLYFFQGQKYTSFGKNILHRQSASVGHSATGHSGNHTNLEFCVSVKTVRNATPNIEKELEPQNLVSSSQSEHKMESALLLDVVIREGPAILQLLPGEDEPLLVGGDSLLVLDLGLHILNRVAGFYLQGDGLAGEGLHEDLHAATEPENQVKSALLLDVVIRKGPAILQLLPGEDEPLLVRGDSLLVLDLSLDILDGVGRLHLEGDRFAR